MLLELAGVERRHQPRRTLGGGQDRRTGHRIALMRHRRRTAATFHHRLAHLSHFGLHQQGKVVSEYPACRRRRQTGRPPPAADRAGCATVSGSDRPRICASAGPTAGPFSLARPECPRRLNCSTSSRGRISRSRCCQRRERVEGARQLQAKGHRQRMLHPVRPASRYRDNDPHECRGRQQLLSSLSGIQRPRSWSTSPVSMASGW